MSKRLIYSVIEYLVVLALMTYSIIRGVLAFVNYFNYDSSQSSMTQTGYMLTGILFICLFIASIVCLIVKIVRDMYRRNFTKKH